MRKKNESLPTIRGGEGVTPLYLAVLQGRSEIAMYLFDKSKEILADDNWVTVFLICINSGLYELALEMQNERASLAFAQDDNSDSQSIIHTAALHRHASIFNLIHEIDPNKDLILRFKDDEGNNLLNCVARLAPPDLLNIVSG
ncbi:hypothetical protein RJT34_14803 [Clitoria ternatea]|uniref:Ankyrin repeat protein n=1 Tax=Clitoria ternatea TaxID=43366 RepID=A0AAN9JR05_CLITE